MFSLSLFPFTIFNISAKILHFKVNEMVATILPGVALSKRTMNANAQSWIASFQKKFQSFRDFQVKLDVSIDVECNSRVREGYLSNKSLSLTSYKFPIGRNVELVPVCRFPFSLQSHPIRNNLNSKRILRQPLNAKFRPGRRVFSTRRSWHYGPQCVTPGKQSKSLTFTI